MKTKAKPSVATLEVSNPTENAEPIKLKVLNADKIEEAEVIEPQKPKPNLEMTTNIISSLHNKIKHVARLTHYIENLEGFTIEQENEDLTKTDYHYQGCALVINDDNRNKFELRNPVLIGEVVNFLNDRLVNKRSEIEAEIVLP